MTNGPDEKTLRFIMQFEALLGEYPEIAIFAMLSNDIGSAIIGNTCPLCALEVLQRLNERGLIHHFEADDKGNAVKINPTLN